MFHTDHGCFPKHIKLIRTDFKHMGWANIHALPASITFICVDDDEPVTRTILKTIVSNHRISFSAFPIHVKSAFRIPESEIGY
jgi:hypothetical protein